MVWQKIAGIKGLTITLQNKAGKQYDIDLKRWVVECAIPDAAKLNKKSIQYWADVDFNNRALMEIRENVFD